MFIGCFGLAVGTTYGAKSQLPAWATIISLLFGWIFVPVIGTVCAPSPPCRKALTLVIPYSCTPPSVTPLQSRILSRCSVVPSSLASPSPTCTLLCRLFLVFHSSCSGPYLEFVFRYGYQSVVQAYTLTGDLKIVSRLPSFASLLFTQCSIQGQYTKLPPRATFCVQVMGSIIVRFSSQPCLTNSRLFYDRVVCSTSLS